MKVTDRIKKFREGTLDALKNDFFSKVLGKDHKKEPTSEKKPIKKYGSGGYGKRSS